ncbi:isochorismatase family cysteine hydrolase [Rhizobium sp. CSW-27]|uniref:cysteine hydrolase family protein n=1 Tax=Rhizobium sp. CSW-27 TaxID=2839985 RepID=UPI001C036903|nr:isochorismatase family cysteine hydrolase [Rhizobium sp. CSW-27]MBT9369115.1 cysteine hydrolase [Rhizobium sp. CSW-27]
MENPGNCHHLCIDMQRLFAEDTPWQIDWMERVRGRVERVARATAQRTIFTRFIPPQRPEAATGMWRPYFEKWSNMTREALGEAMIDLLPELRQLVPPAVVFDKPTYSPWLDGRLHRHLQDKGAGTLVVSGGETDVCVLATVLGAVDLGYRVIVVRDAICSASDQTHDDSIDLLARRFSVQVDLMEADAVLAWWP